MPVVKLHATSLWLPVDGGARSPEHELTRALIPALAQAVIDVVNKFDGSSMTTDEVVIDLHIIHRWAYNTPDMWFDIQPGDAENATEEERKIRRYTIAELVCTALEKEFFSKHEGFRPSYDIECRPLDGSGMSVDKRGIVTQQWGVPKSLTGSTINPQ